jgi:hypothetical protein
LRIGYFIVSALWLKLTGFKYINLAYLSLFSYLLTLIASFVFLKRYLSRKVAVVSCAFLAFSPLAAALSRMAIVDTTSNLLMIISLFLFFECLQGKRAGYLAAFVFFYAAALFTKETAALYAAFFAGAAAYRSLRFKEKGVLILFPALALSFSLVLAFYMLIGSGPYLLRMVNIIIQSPLSNQYALAFGGGPWFRYLLDYFLLSPAIFLLVLLFLVSHIIASRRKEAFIPYAASCFLFTFLAFNLFTKNVRYVFLMDWCLRISAASLLCGIFSAPGRRGYLLLTAAAALIILSDAFVFNRLFISCGIYDPVSFALLKAWNLIP